MNATQIVEDWLLASDPAIRWQAMRDLRLADKADWERERRRVATDGWGSIVLRHQADDGLWNGRLYDGKWVSTTYALYLLKILGLPPDNRQAALGCGRLLSDGLYGGEEIRFSRGQRLSDLGVTALVLSICAYFRVDSLALPAVAAALIRRQRPDGSWRPGDDDVSAKYTFETTLLVLEALMRYRNAYIDSDLAPDMTAMDGAVERGQDFLLERRLYLSDDLPIKKAWTVFAFPSYWFYDVLTVLEYFYRFGSRRDGRIADGIGLLERKMREGMASAARPHPGQIFFEMEQPGGLSRWNTLRIHRVLNWWNGVDGIAVAETR